MTAALTCGETFCPCGCGAWMGQCARQLPHVIYVGPTRLTPFEFEVTAPPLTGVFTFPPSTLMPNDQDESRNALTTPAPPPSEPATRAENEKPEPRIAMNPAPLANPFAEPPPWWEGSFFQATFNKMQSGFDALSKAAAGQDEILAAIQRADSNSTRNYELIRDEIRHLKDSDLKQDERLKQGDKRFEQIERSVEALKVELIARIESEMRVFVEKFQALERLLAEAKANDTARQASAPAAG